jgi:hypothetical protein
MWHYEFIEAWSTLEEPRVIRRFSCGTRDELLFYIAINIRFHLPDIENDDYGIFEIFYGDTPEIYIYHNNELVERVWGWQLAEVFHDNNLIPYDVSKASKTLNDIVARLLYIKYS